MTGGLIVRTIGPQATVQDLGRPGFLSVGLSRGGAADRLAIFEGSVLLGQPPDRAALEMAGVGGTFGVDKPLRIALTGAPMTAALDGRALVWNAVHMILPGQSFVVGATRSGSYGYVSVGGGIETPVVMASRSAHLVARVGTRVEAGTVLPVGSDLGIASTAMTLDVPDRFGGGAVRIVPGGQTEMFAESERVRFEATEFVRDSRGNRQGVRLAFDDAPFVAEGGRSILSEIIVPGDIQMTGEGTPYVLLPECQTTGGYPRIGSVHPNDLSLVAQAAPGAPIRFGFVSLDDARKDYQGEAAILRDLKFRLRPLVRDPRDIPDLLGYQLVSGATAGEEED